MLITESGEFRKGAIIFEAFVKQLFSHTDLFLGYGLSPSSNLHLCVEIVISRIWVVWLSPRVGRL